MLTDSGQNVMSHEDKSTELTAELSTEATSAQILAQNVESETG